MNSDSRIYVAGHTGMVGSALVRRLNAGGYTNLVLRTHGELDLTDQAAAKAFFKAERPEYVFVAAAKVGGIYANSTYPADFITENLLIAANVIKSARDSGVKKLLYLGSSCIYPKLCLQPIKEEYLLTGELEPTNEAYAIAKIAGMKLCEFYNQQYDTRFISAMPASLYGINDRYDAYNAHVIPSMILKFHEAKLERAPYVGLWGTGTPLREFLYTDDMADACILLMESYEDSQFVNIGSGQEISIRALAELIREIVGYEGEIKFDADKPDGTPRRVIDSTKMNALGWAPKIAMAEGLKRQYADFLQNIAADL